MNATACQDATARLGDLAAVTATTAAAVSGRAAAIGKDCGDDNPEIAGLAFRLSESSAVLAGAAARIRDTLIPPTSEETDA